jgi:hypothetical protein
MGPSRYESMVVYHYHGHRDDWKKRVREALESDEHVAAQQVRSTFVTKYSLRSKFLVTG